jgi:DNA-binding transcriptional MerR regulator
MRLVMSIDNRFYKPTDIDILRMENELLVFEIRFLKAKLAELEKQPENTKRQSENQKQNLKAKLAEMEKQLENTKRQAEAEKLGESGFGVEEIEQDLKWLLRRLSVKPFVWIFRFKKGFRHLENKYIK